MHNANIRRGMAVAMALIMLIMSVIAYAEPDNQDGEHGSEQIEEPIIEPDDKAITEPPTIHTVAPTSEPAELTDETTAVSDTEPSSEPTEYVAAQTAPHSHTQTESPLHTDNHFEGTPTDAPDTVPELTENLVSLNVESVAAHLEIPEKKSARISYIELTGVPEDADCEWEIAHVSGDSAKAELSSNGLRAYIDVVALGVGYTTYNAICRYSGNEYIATIEILVTGDTETVPDKIEGINSYYATDLLTEIHIAPSNADAFPVGTKWSLATSSGNVLFESAGASGFTLRPTEQGRYLFVITATTPHGRKLNRGATLVVGPEASEHGLELNYPEINIELDLDSNTNIPMFFVQAMGSLSYLPAEWELKHVDGNKDIVNMYLSTSSRGTLLCVVGVLDEGSAEYALNCHMDTLDVSQSIPVYVSVKRSEDGIAGIAFSREIYAMYTNQALTISPYAIRADGSASGERIKSAFKPVGSAAVVFPQWSVRQLHSSGELTLKIDETGRTTVMASRPGSYELEFCLKLSANRSYYTDVTINVAK